MNLSESLKQKLSEIKSICDEIGNYISIEIASFEELDKAQIGYSIASSGSSLISEEDGAWQEEWMVIGHETVCGDPIILDLSEEEYPISTLFHGMGSWEGGSFLAYSIDNFLSILHYLNQFIKDKEIDKGNKVIFTSELKLIVDKILSENEFVDLEKWQSWVSLFKMAEEYEKEMKRMIKIYKEQGLNLSEIAHKVNLSSKEAYHYWKEA